VRPEILQLTFEPLTGARSGTFEVINHTGQPQTVHLHASERLKLDRHLTLVAGGRTAVAIQIAPVDAAALSEVIRLKAADCEAVLPVRADPKPAALRISPESLTLHGTGPVGVWRGELELENIGGTTLQADLRSAAPFVLSNASITLPAGAKEMLVVTAFAKTARRLEGAMVVESSGGQRTIPLRTGAPAPALTSTRVAEVRRPESAPRQETRPGEHQPPKFSDEQLMLPALAATRLAECTETSATLEWAGALPSGGVRGEVRDLSLVNHELMIRWRPYPAFKAEAMEGKVRGIFSGLNPGQVHAVRVMPNLGDPAVKPVAAALFETRLAPQKARRLTWPRVLLMVGATMVAVVLWERYRSRRSSL
jgi:hypothetical protein